MPLRLDTPIQYVKGVGPRRAELFERAGLRTVGQLLARYPLRFEPAAVPKRIEDVRPGETVNVFGQVRRLRGDPHHLRTCEIHDGTGVLTLRWFHRPFSVRDLRREVMVVASGQAQDYNGRLEIVHPRITVLPPGAAPPSADADASRPAAVYPATAELPSALIRRAVEAALAHPELEIDEFVPDAIRGRERFPARGQAVREMHRPTSDAERERARARLAYEELLLIELALALRRHANRTPPGRRLPLSPEMDARIRSRLPFPLTGAQDAAVREIAADLASGRPMTRLLQGDVGSGKTVVAFYAAMIAVAHGCQAAVMAPTEILARQHFRKFEQYLAGSRTTCGLLLGGDSRARRDELLARTARGDVSVLIGTHALVESGLAFHDLALVVVDEQHKFGVTQRAELRAKGGVPHYLVMTATPIPRTLAMTVFGDLDVTVIRESPPGRGTVVTRVTSREKWPVVAAYVRGRLERGEQAYFVCPARGDENGEHPGDTDAELSTAVALHDELAAGPLAGLPIALLHGALRPAEKEAVMRAFAGGQTRALVATTVVEVGLDVPAAAIMVVDQAERFGLSQLHQLRGRVGRGQRDGLCVLIVHRRDPRARERVDVLAGTTDGFRIAEEDLRLRGPGDLFDTRQHGLPELAVADLVRDFEWVEKARRDALAIVQRDPALRAPEHRALVPALRRMFGARLALADVP